MNLSTSEHIAQSDWLAPRLSGYRSVVSVVPDGSPNLFWPQDHAWCVASEIDLYCTIVGGPQALADALVANPALEAWRVEPEDPVTSDGDRA